MGWKYRWKDANKGFFNICKIAVNAITIIILCILVIIWLFREFGYEPYRILTGSMEPTLVEGEIVWINTNVHDAKESDIIAFQVGEHVVIHRVTGIKPEGTYITKGDANTTEDFDAVDQEDVIGILWMKLGFFTWFLDLFPSDKKWTLMAGLILINIFIEVSADKNKREEVGYA